MPAAIASRPFAALLAGALPFNFMPYSEVHTKFNWLMNGTGASIPHIWSAGANLMLGTKTIGCDIAGGEATKRLPCTGFALDPDNRQSWLGNLRPTCNGYPGTGGNLTATSIVQMTKAGELPD